MKRLFLVLFFIALGQSAFSQRNYMLVKDIDMDNVADTVSLDSVRSCIVCKLSTQNFKPIYSSEIYFDNMNGMGSSLSESEDGFSYNFNWMRSGDYVYYEYELATKRIRAVSMTTYSYGNAVNDGMGELGFDLIEGGCSGTIHNYDEKEELIPMDIDLDFSLPPMYLEDFDTGIIFEIFTKAYSLKKERDEAISPSE